MWDANCVVPMIGGENYFNGVALWAAGVHVCLDFGECLSSRSSAPHFPGSVAVSPSQSWRAGSWFSQDGVCSVPSDWCCIKATQAWKRFLQHPQRHSIPRVIQGVWGAEPIIPELLTLQPLWARTAISFLGACFTVKPLIVRPFLW